MEDPLCRVAIQCADAARAVDVALPRYAALGMLLPDIVDLVLGETAHPPDGPAQGWRLDRVRGGRCDESMSLHEIGVVDGDVIVLSGAAAPPPGPLPQDVFRTVARTEARVQPPSMPAGAWAGAGAAAAIALGYAGIVVPSPVPVALAGIAAVACVLIARRAAALRTTLQAGCIGFCCVTGLLVVPAPAGMAGVVLGAAAGSAASLWLLRACAADVGFFTATATALGLLAVVGAPSLLLPIGIGAQGAALGVLSVGLMTAAGRVTIGLSGPRPALPGPDAARIRVEVVARSRAVFTGLVSGGAAAAALAVGFVAAGGIGSASWPPNAALATALSALLLLRARFYADLPCRAAAGWCGLVGAVITVALVTVSAPRYGGPGTVLTVAVAGWWHAGPAGRAPSWSRIVDIVEYVLIAAVVPLACWVAGLYQVVRSLSLG